MFEHFVVNKIFHANHHGGLPNHSTATALIQLYDLWLNAAENHELIAALLLDLSAAYDLLNHSILIKKLLHYGFDSDARKYVKSYLEDRKQIVQVESKQSEPKEIGDTSVPQGSVLGGFFFLVFENDFPASSEDSEAILFVDDDTENISDCNEVDLKDKVQRMAKSSTQWVRDNDMVCAGDKTKLLIVGTKEAHRNRENPIQIEVCGEMVTESSAEKLLGVIVSNDFSWKVHLYGNNKTGKDKITGVITKLSQRVGMLKRLSTVMPAKKFNNVSQGIFNSKLTYCLQLFGNVWGIQNLDENRRRFSAFTKDDNRKLQTLQNRVLRLKLGLPQDTPLTTLLERSNDMSVMQLTAYHSLMMTHRVVTSGQPAYLAKKLELRTQGEGMFPQRQANTIALPNVDLTLSRSGFCYRGAALWNSLPADMRMCTKTETFKRELKKWVQRNIGPRPP